MPDGWEEKVYSWLWDNDQRELDDVDDRGPYPSAEAVRTALCTLDLTDDCPSEDCALGHGHEGLHQNEEGWPVDV